jgi:DNA-binding response OmpR family regulator
MVNPKTLLCLECQHGFRPGRDTYQDAYLYIDISQLLVCVGGEEVELSPIGYRLLHCLLANSPRTVEHRQILSSVWGWEYQNDIDLVRVQVWHLRQKLEPDPSNPRYIVNRNGLGYYFRRYDD